LSVNKSYISKLKLTHYRNYNTLNLELPDKPVALIGSNGIGKTNILEAISLLQPGRGIRSAKFKEMTYKQNGSFGIFIELVSSEEKILIGTAFDDQVSRIRKIKINENNYISQLDLTKYLRIISLTPLMDKIFIESPKNRRKFIDRITWNFFPEHSVIMRAYDKVLKERNNLLKDKTSDFKWLENIEKQIVDFGTKILLNRNKAIKMLVFKLVERKKLNNVFPIADIFLVGELEELYNKQAGDNFINLYKEKLFNYRELDSLKGSSSLGPHRTELRVNY